MKYLLYDRTNIENFINLQKILLKSEKNNAEIRTGQLAGMCTNKGHPG